MKYYKADAVINLLATEYYTYNQAEIIEVEDCKATAEFNTKHLPTIEANEDCISRKYLEEEYWQTLIPKEMVNTDIDLGINIGIQKMYEVMKDAPSVIPQAKEGEWITEKDSYEIICSKCKCEAFSDYGGYIKTNYCPDCGAKMKGVSDEGTDL